MTSRRNGPMTFFFDAASCSGCKACEVACMDRHGLEVGRLWRRVSEVTGGGWERDGAAWRNTVFAYHLSIACNHCERPICLEGCPSRAITRREDGVVLIEGDRIAAVVVLEIDLFHRINHALGAVIGDHPGRRQS